MSNPTETRKVFLGPAVDPKTRELRYTSVSAMSKFDETQFAGCERKWFFRYVMRLPEPPLPHQELGIRVHAQKEHYLKTGEDVLGEIARPGKRFLPTPGPDLLVEWGLNDKPKSAEGEFFSPEESLLRADGVPLIGFIDLVNPRGVFIDSDGQTRQDPSGTVEIHDHKTTSNLRYAKSPGELVTNTQMVGCAEWAAQKYPDLTHVRVSHLYLATRGEPDALKRTAIIPLAEVRQRWYDSGHSVVRRMRGVAQAEKPEDVHANEASCDAYKGCPFKITCIKSPIRRLQVSLMSKVKDLSSKTNGALPPPPAPQQVIAAPVQTPVTAVSAPLAVTAAPLAVTAASPAQLPPAPKKLVIEDQSTTPDSIAAQSAQQGKMYRLSNGAIVMFLCPTMGKYSFVPVPGGGNPYLLDGTERVVETVYVAQTPVQQTPVQQAPVQQAPAAVYVAPTPVQSTEQFQAVPPPRPLEVVEQLEKKRRGRPKKDAESVEQSAAVEQSATQASPATAPQVATQVATQAGVQTGIRLYINAIPSGPFQTLDAYVGKLTSAIQEQFQVTDIRCPQDQNSPLSYSKWRGVLASLVRNEPPPPGDYVAFTSGSELNDVVVEALAPLCALGALVRGIR